MAVDYVSFKIQLSNSLKAAYEELQARCRDSSVKDIQRIYGVVLGVRIALLEWNKAHVTSVPFAGHLAIQSLLDNDFSSKSLNEYRNYQFPEF